MVEGDVRPGMFLDIAPFLDVDEPIIVFVVRDNAREASYDIVDLRHGQKYMSYQAVTKDVEEFDGDVLTARREAVKAVFL
jgi:hypothetical protein